MLDQVCRIRYLRPRHRRAFMGIFVLFVVFFGLKDGNWGSNNEAGIGVRNRGNPYPGDTVTSLRSQLGYVKSKYARAMGHAIDANDHSTPTIYVITPTYNRDVQKAELVRLCHTFLLVPNLHWIVVEDSKHKTEKVANLLKNCGVSFTHLSAYTPPEKKLQQNEKRWRKPRGVIQRNEGLIWLRNHAHARTHAHPDDGGVIYFADDDNTYGLGLFDAIRDTKKVSVFNVGLVGGLMVEKPRVSKEEPGKVTGWEVIWAPQRPFAVDMAGFAVNLNYLLTKPKAKFAYEVKIGFQESEFLKHLVTMDDLEPKAIDQVFVWHTRTEKVKLDMERKLMERGSKPSDVDIEV